MFDFGKVFLNCINLKSQKLLVRVSWRINVLINVEKATSSSWKYIYHWKLCIINEIHDNFSCRAWNQIINSWWSIVCLSNLPIQSMLFYIGICYHAEIRNLFYSLCCLFDLYWQQNASLFLWKGRQQNCIETCLMASKIYLERFDDIVRQMLYYLHLKGFFFI